MSWVLGALGLMALLWACRGAPLGAAVADDYSFLYRRAFQHPLDPFDSMGAAYYWRPLSRQAYFSLVGGWLLRAPWAVAGVNALLLLALFAVLYRVARRGFDPPVTAAVALVPLLSESARVLLTWPSGAQHLLASLGASLALHEVLAGRIATGGVAALAGVLSHESAWVALPALPLITWLRTRRLAATLRWGAVALAVTCVWATGYQVALAHGVRLPGSDGGTQAFVQLPQLFRLAVMAALNLEDLAGSWPLLLGCGHGALLAIAVVVLGRRVTRAAPSPRRANPRAMVPVLAGATFVVGLLPLAYLLPDWNAWRSWVPSLALGGGLAVLFGLVSPWLSGAFAALRLVGLLLATPVPPGVTHAQPASTSDFSFVRLARMQRTVASAHRALTARYPTLPHRAITVYWSLPRMVSVAFVDSLAVRVWYHDATLSWRVFDGMSDLTRPIDAMLEFIVNDPSPASVVEPQTLRLFRQGVLAILEGRRVVGDSLLTLASRQRSAREGPIARLVMFNLGISAYNQGDFTRADSLAREVLRISGESADYWSLVAYLAYAQGARETARRAVQRSLAFDPQHEQSLRLAGAMMGDR